MEHDAPSTEDAAAPKTLEMEIENGQIPHIGFGNMGFPLFAPTGHDAWALLNLILCAIGMLYVVVTTMRVVFMKKRTQTEVQKIYCVSSEPAANEFPDEDEEKRYRPGWLAAAAVLAIAGAYLFALTENMRNPTVLIDGWTLAHAIIITAQVIAANVVFKGENQGEGGEGDAQEASEEPSIGN